MKGLCVKPVVSTWAGKHQVVERVVVGLSKAEGEGDTTNGEGTMPEGALGTMCEGVEGLEALAFALAKRS